MRSNAVRAVSSIVSRYLPGEEYFAAVERLRDNPGQWQVFDSIGNCVVLAGPGSGKTHCLTIKAARMLIEDVIPPQAIACITYSNECVRSLRRQFALLGVSEQDGIFVSTMHAFCLRHVVAPFASVAGVAIADPVVPATRTATQEAFDAAAHDVYGASIPATLWRDVQQSRVALAIGAAFDEADEVARVAAGYEMELSRRGVLDFGGMTYLALRLVREHGWVRRAITAKFPILVIDEYQDFGDILHALAMHLLDTGALRLLAVGDPDQSIYGFQGAKPEHISNLAARPGIESVRLPFNYRSGQRLVDASEAALGTARGYRGVPADPGEVFEYECPGGLGEQADRICDEVIPEARSRLGGIDLGRVAVLYPDKYVGHVIAAAAAARAISVQRQDAGAPYEKSPFTRWLEDAAAWCADGWRDGTPLLSAVLGEWRRWAPAQLEYAAVAVREIKMAEVLLQLRQPDLPLAEWLLRFSLGCLDAALAAAEWVTEREELRRLRSLASPGNVLASLTVRQFGGQRGSPRHLNLLTLHSAKGLEFDVIVLMGMDDGALPSYRDQTESALREARRRFYVGLTRARREVHITYSGYTESPAGTRFYRGPSPMLAEVRERLRLSE